MQPHHTLSSFDRKPTSGMTTAGMSQPKPPSTTAPSPFPDWLPVLHRFTIVHRSALVQHGTYSQAGPFGVKVHTARARVLPRSHALPLDEGYDFERDTNDEMQDDIQGDSAAVTTSPILAPKLEAAHCLWKDCCAEFGVKAANDFGEGRTHLARLELNALPSKKLSAHPPDRSC